MSNTAAGQCRYHSDQSTRWYCRDCDLPLCTTCKPYADQLPQDVSCPLCRQPMDDIAVGDPLWRNPKPFLAYPLDRNCLIMMAVLAAFVAVLASGLFSLLAVAVATVVLIRGSFVVIERSSLGHVRAPSLREFANPDNLSHNLQFALTLLIAAVPVGLGWIAGTALMWLILVPIAALLPAMLMAVFIDGNAQSALDYRRITAIVRAMGAGYGVLGGACALFALATTIVLWLLGFVLPGWLLAGLAMLAWSYLTLLTARLIGHCLHQYRRQLEFGPALDRVTQHVLPPTEVHEPARALADASIQAIEGDVRQARLTVGEALVRHPENDDLNRYFDHLILASEDQKKYRNHMERRLRRLVARDQPGAAAELWLRNRKNLEGWLPRIAETRHHMALALEQRGHPKVAVKLLLRLPKTDPRYSHLPEACLEAARILEQHLDDREQATTLRDWVLKRHPQRAEYWYEQRQQDAADSNQAPVNPAFQA
jgi:hypothetical protein